MRNSSTQAYNIPKLAGLESGGDFRCFIIDNHRPIHLNNIHSKYSVVIFDDEVEMAEDANYIPSDGDDNSEAAAEEDSDEELDGDNEEEAAFDEENFGEDDIIDAEDIQKAFADDEEAELEGEGDEDDEEAEEEEEEGEERDEEKGETEKDEEPADLDQTVPLPEDALDKTVLMDSAEEEAAEAVKEGESGSLSDNDDDGRKVGRKTKSRGSSVVEDREGQEDESGTHVTRVESWQSTSPASRYSGRDRDRGTEPAADEEEAEGADMDITTNLFDEREDGHDADSEDNGSHMDKVASKRRRQQEEDNEEEKEEQEEDDGSAGDDEGEEEVRVRGRRREGPVDREKQRRQRLRAYYRRLPWHAAPSSVMLTHLLQAAQGRMSQEMLWQASLGATDLYLRGASSEALYSEYLAFVRVRLGSAVRDSRERNSYSVAGDESKASDSDRLGHKDIPISLSYDQYIFIVIVFSRRMLFISNMDLIVLLILVSNCKQ